MIRLVQTQPETEPLFSNIPKYSNADTSHAIVVFKVFYDLRNVGEVWYNPGGTWMAGDLWMGWAWPADTRATAIRILIPKGGHLYE